MTPTESEELNAFIARFKFCGRKVAGGYRVELEFPTDQLPHDDPMLREVDGQGMAAMALTEDFALGVAARRARELQQPELVAQIMALSLRT